MSQAAFESGFRKRGVNIPQSRVIRCDLLVVRHRVNDSSISGLFGDEAPSRRGLPEYPEGIIGLSLGF
jgi:hypothetical protein